MCTAATFSVLPLWPEKGCIISNINTFLCFLYPNADTRAVCGTKNGPLLGVQAKKQKRLRLEGKNRVQKWIQKNPKPEERKKETLFISPLGNSHTANRTAISQGCWKNTKTLSGENTIMHFVAEPVCVKGRTPFWQWHRWWVEVSDCPGTARHPNPTSQSNIIKP